MPLTCAHCPVSRQARLPEQVGAAQNACAEQQPLVGQPLDVRRRDRLAVGLDVAARVVGVQVDDVRVGPWRSLIVRSEQ